MRIEKKKNLCFALYFGNRGFFPGELITEARRQVKDSVEKLGFSTIMMAEEATRFGAVETVSEGRNYAAFLEENRGRYDGIILSLPNFGDENGAIAALEDCGVPILIQAYPDEFGQMDFEHRRDAFCGKFSIMDVFYQYSLPFTVFQPHTVNPEDPVFSEQLLKFAAVCRVAKGMKKFTVGAVGARTTAFKTVRFDELAMQKYCITTETFDLSDILKKIKEFGTKSDIFRIKKDHMLGYTGWDGVPDEKVDLICKTACVMDNLIEECNLDSLALRCWNEFECELGISPCVVLSAINDKGIAAACELDVANAVPMRALSLASEAPSTVLDWNNNYGNEEDKCILFHCGPVPQKLMSAKGQIVDHPMFAKSYGAGCGWGANVGRLSPGDMTYSSAKTEDGKLIFYVGEGKITNDPIEDAFFGCGGVANIPNLQNKLLKIGKNGYRHHVGMTIGHHAEALKEAFSTYLKYDLINLD